MGRVNAFKFGDPRSLPAYVAKLPIMKTLLRNVLAVVVIALSPQAGAEYKTYGEGATTCGSWIEARRNDNYYIKAQWMLGFVSAAGYYGEKPKFTDASAMVVWVDNYCQQNPLKDFDDGVKALVEELSRQK